jgi:YD repeat-containing protein
VNRNNQTDANEGYEYRYGRVKGITVDSNQTSGLNITAEYDYDILGRVSEVNDPNGAVTAFVYNAFDKLVKMTASAGRDLKFNPDGIESGFPLARE